ncbi:MAG: alpha/beta hydrolase, partial [Clostridia bacterium]|nr:alpha/beta hydrolase [Clostridia bacterium]
KLHNLVKIRYQGLPYFMFGHSMGSFIARDYAASYGNDLTGMTICGTTGVFRHAEETGKLIEQAIAEGKGKESDAEYTMKLMGWMCERCDEVSIGNEWICSDPFVQRDHADDPFDAFTKPTSNQSVLYFIQMMEVITGTEWAKKVPESLPIYNIGGDQDPVGEYGKGIYEVSNWLSDTRHSVKTKVYSGYRHEIHNYSEIKHEVEQGIIEFMDQLL